MTSEIDRLIDDVVADFAPHYADNDIASNYLDVHKIRYSHDLQRISERVKTGDRIFDFGAFPGVICEVLTRMGHSVVAGDIDPEKYPFPSSAGFPALKANANVDRIDVDSESFDVVLLMEVFEHLCHNPIVTMREVHRILRPGGLLYLTTPNGLGLRTLIRVLRKGKLNDVYSQWARVEPEGVAGHIREYTPREMSEFLVNCGYTNVDVETSNVYKKGNLIEHYFWRAASWPFPGMRENISCFAMKPGAEASR